MGGDIHIDGCFMEVGGNVYRIDSLFMSYIDYNIHVIHICC